MNVATVTVVTYLLIVWAVASDGLPTVPITITPQRSLSACTVAKIEAQKQPGTKAACRLVRSL